MASLAALRVATSCVRNMLYALLFLVLGWRCTASCDADHRRSRAEIVITLMDFVERTSRNCRQRTHQSRCSRSITRILVLLLPV
jgi:hypothetical protein